MIKKSIYQQEKQDWNQNCSFYVAEERSIFKKLLNQKTLNTFVIKKGKILDIGCATGHFLNLLPESCQKYGVDFAENFIVYAKKHRPNINFKVAAAEKLPFKKRSFDGVIFKGTLHHLKAQGLLTRSLKEADRVLKSGGKIYIHDRCDSFFGKLFHQLAINIRQALKKVNLLKSTSASDNEPEFGLKDLDFLTKSKKYKILKSKPIFNIFFFQAVLITNFIQYSLGFWPSEIIRIILLPFIIISEKIFNTKHFCVEQLIVVEKTKL